MPHSQHPNVVADALSWANEGTKNKSKNGSEWTVLEDWEGNIGLTHDIFHIEDANGL